MQSTILPAGHNSTNPGISKYCCCASYLLHRQANLSRKEIVKGIRWATKFFQNAPTINRETQYSVERLPDRKDWRLRSVLASFQTPTQRAAINFDSYNRPTFCCNGVSTCTNCKTSCREKR